MRACASSCPGPILRVDLTIEDGLWKKAVKERRGSVKRKVGKQRV